MPKFIARFTATVEIEKEIEAECYELAEEKARKMYDEEYSDLENELALTATDQDLDVEFDELFEA